jgi:5'(3')-deoxyribonucleotidase
LEEEAHECFMDITLDRCEIRKDLYNKNIDGWKIREYADYHCDTIEEKKLFFDGSVGSF